MTVSDYINLNNINHAEQGTTGQVRRPASVDKPGGYGGSGGLSGVSGIQGQPSFANELKKVQSGVKFSKHAEARLATRNIDLSGEQRMKLSAAIEKADRKGLKDTLVMLDGIALVANVKSRTIVTAVGSGELKENIFTNIDGAVFA